MTATPPPEGLALTERVRDLELRVAALELDLRLVKDRPPVDAPRATVAVPIRAPMVATPPPLPVVAGPVATPTPAAPPAALDPRADAGHLGRLASAASARRAGDTATEQGPSSLAGTARTGAPARDRPAARVALSDAFEQRIGGRLFAIAGALVVVIGLGLFMKLAVDQGWLGLMPPTIRCIFGAVFGLVLVLTGELARRRINAWAATGLFAAGIGAVYLSIYAAYAFFSLLSPGTAFVLLALAAALGVGAAVRANLAAVAVISLAGGYLAPLLVRSTNPSALVLPIYLLVLLAGGLSLSAWKRGHFRLVGGVAWTGTLLLGTPWLLFQGRSAPEIALVFLAVAWGLMHAGHALSLWAPALPEPAYDDETPRSPVRLSPAAALAVGASVSASSWAVGFGAWVLHGTGLLPEWMAPAAAIAPCIVLGQVLAGGLRVLRDSPRTNSEAFGAVLLVQAAGLLIATIALGVSGTAVVVVWLGLGLAAIVAGNWVGARGLRVYGVVLLTIGTARLVSYDLFFLGAATPLAARWGVEFSWWMLLAAGAGCAWLAAAELLRRGRALTGDAIAKPASTLRPLNPALCAAVIGVLLLTIAPVNRGTEAAPLMFMWAGLAVVLSLGAARVVKAGVCGLALIPAVLAVAAWRVAFVGGDWLHFSTTMPVVGLHSGAWAGLGLLIAGAMVWTRLTGVVRGGWALVLAVFALYWTSVEAARLGGVLFHPPTAPIAVLAFWWMTLSVGASRLASRWPGRDLRPVAAAPMLAALVAWGIAFLNPSARGFTQTMPVYGLHMGVWTLLPMLVMATLILRGIAEPARRRLLLLLALFGGAITTIEAARLGAVFSLRPTAPVVSVAAWWLVLGLGATAFGRVRNSLAAQTAALLPAGASLLAWAAAFVAPGGMRLTTSMPSLGLHSGTWAAAPLLAGTWWITRGSPGPVRLAALWVIALAGFYASTLEVVRLAELGLSEPRAALAAVSIWWGLLGIAAVVVGFLRRVPPVRYAALTLMTLAAGKVLVIDLAGAPPMARIASLVATGLLMLAVSVIYARVAKKLAQEEDHRPG
ncbi:MAG: DUF2339 domain-containing protein [Phycisphaerales bacterium]